MASFWVARVCWPFSGEKDSVGTVSGEQDCVGQFLPRRTVLASFFRAGLCWPVSSAQDCVGQFLASRSALANC